MAVVVTTGVILWALIGATKPKGEEDEEEETGEPAALQTQAPPPSPRKSSKDTTVTILDKTLIQDVLDVSSCKLSGWFKSPIKDLITCSNNEWEEVSKSTREVFKKTPSGFMLSGKSLVYVYLYF